MTKPNILSFYAEKDGKDVTYIDVNGCIADENGTPMECRLVYKKENLIKSIFKKLEAFNRGN